MTKISASEVNKLRKMSGAGIMDCKNALVESNGDFDLAIEILRKKGQKVAAKRAERESSEGAVIAKVDSDCQNGVIISLNCETDFVAKNDGFISLANEFANLALSSNSIEEFLNSTIDSMTVSEKLVQQTGVIGEKLVIGNFEKLSAAYVGKYIHAGNKIATLSGFSSSSNGIEEIAKNVAMQAAAMNPIALDENGVDQSTIDKEIEIAAEDILPQVSWGTSPEMVLPVDGVIPHPENEKDEMKRIGMSNAPVSYTHLRAHETPEHLVCRLLLEKKKTEPREN